MAYYFMVESKKGKHTPIDITKSKYFTKKTKFTKEGACSLEEIDMFTTSFKNEIELKIKLASEGILPKEFIDKPITARILNKEKYSKVTYDLLYQKDIEYILEPKRIIQVILEKYYQKDYLFMQRFGEHFQRFYKCESSAPELRQYAQMSIIKGSNYRCLDELDKEGNLPIVRLAKLIIYESYQHRDGSITYLDKVKYSNLHHLIAFINNYNKKIEQNYFNQKNIIETENDQITFDTFINISTPEYIDKPKTRIRKKEQIIGQMCLFEEE